MCEGGQREIEGGESETQRDTEVEKRKKGSEEENGLYSESVTCIHLTFAYGTNLHRRYVLKVKNKMNAFIAAPIVCGQSCVILLLSVQTGKKNQRKPLRDS